LPDERGFLAHRNGRGVWRLPLHKARFSNSARKFQFLGAGPALAAVEHAASDVTGPTRLRLELFADGRFDLKAQPFTPLAEDVIWIIGIATTARLDSTQPLLRHKTSLRAVYDAARAEYRRDEADEVLLLNQQGDICEGAITNIFVPGGDGRLLTPPLSSGCLAGVLRTSLICAGKARVMRLSPSDLEGRSFFVGNSLRGLIPARMI
jgi:4-amino-4-deoxychorismate lyase